MVYDLPVYKVPAFAIWAGRVRINRFGAEVQFGEAGEMREIDSRVDGRSLRGADRGDVVVYQRIAIQG